MARLAFTSTASPGFMSPGRASKSASRSGYHTAPWPAPAAMGSASGPQAMTANTFAEDVRDAFAAGMDGHLAKPIDMDAVRSLVGRLLNRTKEIPEREG